MPFSPYTRRRMSFSPPAAACVTVKVPRAPLSNSSSADTWSTTLRPGRSAPTSAATRFTACPLTKHARCCAWQPIALITSASPLRCGVEQPAQPVVLRAVFDARGERELDVLHLHEPDRADRAVAHQLARMARHRIGAVAVRDREQPLVRLHARRQVLRLRQRHRDRLVADHVEAGIERGGGVGWCVSLGVMIATASMPSLRCFSARSISSTVP